MTAIDTYILDDPTDDADATQRRANVILVLSCLFIAAMFMLATNDMSATSRWETVTRDQVSTLAVAMESGRGARQFGFLSMGAWGAITLFLTRRRFRIDPLFLFPLGLLLVWAGLSVIWSQDRGFTAKRLVLLGCVGVAVIAFVRRFKVRDLALLALIGCSLQMALSIVFDLLYATGEYGKSGYRFSGLQHPNHSGINAMFLIFACLYFHDRTRQRRYLVVLAAAAVVMYLTRSRSSLIAGLVAISVFASLRWRPRTVAVLGIAALGAVGVFFMMVAANLVSDGWSDIIHMGREDASASALTGRPEIWAAALEALGHDRTRLLLGAGYDSFWTPAVAEFVSNRVWFRISEGHCAYFDTLLELGVIGVCCYIFLILGSLYRYVRLAWINRTCAYAFAAMVVTFASVHGLTESTTVDPNFPTFFSFTAFAFLALRAPRLRDFESGVST